MTVDPFGTLSRKGYDMNLPLPKLKAILLYFSNYTDTKFLGKTKLMKLFYFLDFTHLKEYGTPVTFDNYVKLEHGPIPSTIKNLVDEAADDIDISELSDTIHFEKLQGINMVRILPNRNFTKDDASLFSETELEILKKVCLRFGDKNTQYIEKASHLEAPWRLTEIPDQISYVLAAEDSDSKVSKEEIELALELLK